MYIILDLEATCWDGTTRDDSETIEIGAVMLDAFYRVIGEFQSFVRPVRNEKLSPFCTSLTTITQEQVDSASPFPEVVDDLEQQIKELKILHFPGAIRACRWMRLSDMEFRSWGYYDMKQLKKDCAFHRIVYPFGHHQSVKHDLAGKYGGKMGLKKALRRFEMGFEGTQHRALDDAKNIARIFVREYGNQEEK